MEKRNKKYNQTGKASNAARSTGADVEYSRELADHSDLEAQSRANAADQRQKKGRR